MTADGRPRLYTIDDLREILGVSRATVFRLMADGRLPSVKFGKRRQFRMEDIQALIDEEAQRSVTETH